VASGAQYRAHPAQPLPVSQASKKAFAVSMLLMNSFLPVAFAGPVAARFRSSIRPGAMKTRYNAPDARYIVQMYQQM
jgi:hypothetical protein